MGAGWLDTYSVRTRDKNHGTMVASTTRPKPRFFPRVWGLALQLSHLYKYAIARSPPLPST